MVNIYILFIHQRLDRVPAGRPQSLPIEQEIVLSTPKHP